MTLDRTPVARARHGPNDDDDPVTKNGAAAKVGVDGKYECKALTPPPPK